MKRRRLIAIISLCTLAALGIIGVVGGMVVMRTDWPRNFVQSLLAARINGSVYIGRISGNPLGALVVDSVVIRDTSGAVVVSASRLEFDYDIRDVIDQRIYLRHVTVERPHIHLRDYGAGFWNYMTLRKGGPKGPDRPSPRSWGDYFVLDSVRATNASFFLSLPWSPDTALRGAARDSVIRYALARKDKRTERHPTSEGGFSRTYMWTRANALVTHARLADPDSTKFGQEIHVADLDVNEFDPPFVFRNVRGVVRRLDDSLWFDLDHWDLPASTGTAKGKLVWGSKLPMRYDIVVPSDSMALADINWVYPTLPTTGGGKMVLRISNKRNLRVFDYHIDKMDVRSTGSHLVGEMTFGVGGPVLQLLNVNLRANPVDFALVKRIAGGLPIDWRGQIFGNIRAPGGPLDDFDVASFNGEWRDTHVPGAVSRLSGSGGLDIEFPAKAAFHGFDLDVESLDLRSIEFLFPAFPKLNGTIAGRATLDSVWTDVRFSDADLTHRDGPGTPSRFTGSGRVTDGRPFITYDVDLIADPLSFDMLARSFPRLTLRGLAYGPMKIKGQSADLQVVTNLVSAGGAVRFAGNIDIDSLGGYGARGVGEVTRVNLARLGIKPNAATTSLSGRYALDVRGATPSTLSGTADLRLGLSTYDRIPLDSLSRATFRFDRGRAFTTDTLVINSPMGRLTALGAIGLPGGGTDSIAVTLVVDSVGGLRPYFTPAGTVADSLFGKVAPADTLLGAVTINGYAIGTLDSLLVRGVIAGDNLFVRGIKAKHLSGDFSISDALGAPSGTITARGDSVILGGLVFDTLKADIGLVDSTRGRFTVNAGTIGGDSLRMTAGGGWTRLMGATATRFDAFTMSFANSHWALAQPATLFLDSLNFRVDSLHLRDARGGSIGLAGDVPKNGAIDLRLSATQVPLFDLDRIVGQVQAPVSGFADLGARMTGTRDKPFIDARTTLDSIAISNVHIGRLLGSARYADNFGTINADIFQGDKRVLHAVADSLPLSVKWFTYDTLPGRVRVTATADSAEATLLQAWVSEISKVTGKIFGNFSVDGTWKKPNIVANASMTDGGMNIDTLGIALSKIYGALSVREGTLSIDTLAAQSGGERNTARMNGTIVFDGWKNSSFDIRMWMNDFQAYHRLELATVYARTDSGPIRLWGTLASDSLTGVVQVDRGAIYLPDPKLVVKQFAAFDSISVGGAPTDKTLYQRVTDNLQTDLRAHIGGAFKLSADYADIPLTGDLRIVPVTQTDVARSAGDFVSRLAPIGVINADRGTYTLDLFPINRPFDVQRGGTIQFDRDAQWNGVLNVSARYVIRKPGRPEVPIVVDVTDRLLTPKVKVRSDATFPISESDLISYLVFEEPGFDVLGQTERFVSGEGIVSSLFTPIATSFASEQLKNRLLGRWIDQFRFETTNLDQSTQQGGLDRYLFALRLRGEKELFGKMFVSVSAGACGFKPGFREDQNFGQQFYQQLGFNLDYRFQSQLQRSSSLQIASEPSTESLLCTRGYLGSQGVGATPRQYSLSLPLLWRW